MNALVKIGVLGGLGYGAFRLGLLDDLLPNAGATQAEKDAVFGAGNDALAALQNIVAGDGESEEGGATGGLFGRLFGGSTNSTTISKEQALLEEHWDDVHPWARRNKTWTAAMMWQESRGNPRATSSAGARGVLQVMPATMGDIVRWGYDRYGNDPDVLYQAGPCIYFGTAYLQYLSGISSNRDWITRAYNAGPGGENARGRWPRETVNYLASIKGRYEELTEG